MTPDREQPDGDDLLPPEGLEQSGAQPEAAPVGPLPRLTLDELLARYGIAEPVNFDVDRPKWEAEAARTVIRE